MSSLTSTFKYAAIVAPLLLGACAEHSMLRTDGSCIEEWQKQVGKGFVYNAAESTYNRECAADQNGRAALLSPDPGIRATGYMVLEQTDKTGAFANAANWARQELKRLIYQPR